MLSLIRTLHIANTIPKEHIDDIVRAFQRCLSSGAKPEKLYHIKHVLYALRAGKSQRVIYTRSQATSTSLLVLDFLANHEYQKIDHHPDLYTKYINPPILTTDFTVHTIFPDDAHAGLVVFSDATHYPSSVQPQKTLTMDQIQALSTIYQRKPPISVIQGPAGSGKSMLTPWLFACLSRPGKKLYLAPSKELALQQRNRLQAFLHNHSDFKSHLDNVAFCFVDAKASSTSDILSLYSDAQHAVLPLIPNHDLQDWCQHQCSAHKEIMPSWADLEHLLTSLDIKIQTVDRSKSITNETWRILEHELREQYPEATKRIASGCITNWYQQYAKHRQEKKWRSEDDDVKWFRQQRDLQPQDKKLFSECDRASLMQLLHVINTLPSSAHINFIHAAHLTDLQQARIPALLVSYRKYQDANNLRSITIHDVTDVVSTYPIIVMDEWLQDLPLSYQLAQAVQQKKHHASPHRLFFLGDMNQANMPFSFQTVLLPLMSQDTTDDLVCITLQDSHRTPILITTLCQKILYEIHGRIGANLGALPTLNTCNQEQGKIHMICFDQCDTVIQLAERIRHQFIDTLCIVNTQAQADELMQLLLGHIEDDDILIQVIQAPSDIAGVEFANIILLDEVLSQLPHPEYFSQHTHTTPLSHKHKNKHATQEQLYSIYALRTLYLYFSRALSSLSIVSTKKASGHKRKWLDGILQVVQEYSSQKTPPNTTQRFPANSSTPNLAIDNKPRASREEPVIYPPNQCIHTPSAQALPPRSLSRTQQTSSSQLIAAHAPHTYESVPNEHIGCASFDITHARCTRNVAVAHASASNANYLAASTTSSYTTHLENIRINDDPSIHNEQSEQDSRDEANKIVHRILDFLNLKGSDDNLYKLIQRYQLKVLKKEKKDVLASCVLYASVIKSIHEASDLDLNTVTLHSILRAEAQELDGFEGFLRQLASGYVDTSIVPKHVEPDIWQGSHALCDALANRTSQHAPNASIDEATTKTSHTSEITPYTNTNTNTNISLQQDTPSFDDITFVRRVAKAQNFFKTQPPQPLTQKHITYITRWLEDECRFAAIFCILSLADQHQSPFFTWVHPTWLTILWQHPKTHKPTYLLHHFMQHICGWEEIKRYCASQETNMALPTISFFFSPLDQSSAPMPLLSLAIDYDPESIEQYWPNSSSFSQMLYQRYHSTPNERHPFMLEQLADKTFLRSKQYAAAKLAKLYFTHVIFLTKKLFHEHDANEYYKKMKRFGAFLTSKMALLWHSKKGYVLLEQYAKIVSASSLLPYRDTTETSTQITTQASDQASSENLNPSSQEMHVPCLDTHFSSHPDKPANVADYHHTLEQMLMQITINQEVCLCMKLIEQEVCQRMQEDIIGFTFYLEKPYDLFIKALQHGHFKAAKYISERTEALSDIPDYEAFANMFIPLSTQVTSKMVKLASDAGLHLLAAHDLAAILQTLLGHTSIKLPQAIVSVLGIYSSMDTIQLLSEKHPAYLLHSDFSENIVIWACFAERKGLKANLCNAFHLPIAPKTTQARDWLLIHYPKKFLEIDTFGRSILKNAILCPLDSLVIWLIEHQAILPKLFAREWIRLLLLGTPKYRRLTSVKKAHDSMPQDLLIAQNNRSLSCFGLFDTSIRHPAISPADPSNAG